MDMFLFYGQEVQKFTVLRSGAVTTSAGRVLQNQLEEVGEISGVLAVARSEERERWKQLAHMVSHKVVVKSALPFSIRAGDVLRVGSRELIVSNVPYDVGGLGHFVVIYGNERNDLG